MKPTKLGFEPMLVDWLAYTSHSKSLPLRTNERLCCENRVFVLFPVLFQIQFKVNIS